MNELKTVLEVSQIISQRLNEDVPETRIRQYENDGFVSAKRVGEMNYRHFSNDDIDVLYKVVVFSELNVPKEVIHNHIKNPYNAEYMLLIVDYINKAENKARLARELLSNKKSNKA